MRGSKRQRARPDSGSSAITMFVPVSRYKRPNASTGVASKVSLPARVSPAPSSRSEEHTSELQSRGHLVCRLLLEKKKKEYQTVNQSQTKDVMTTYSECL